jgi:hypothetical protein
MVYDKEHPLYYTKRANIHQPVFITVVHERLRPSWNLFHTSVLCSFVGHSKLSTRVAKLMTRNARQATVYG